MCKKALSVIMVLVLSFAAFNLSASAINIDETDEQNPIATLAASGTQNCILSVAMNELGKKDASVYTDWFGAARGELWCAIFVSWCANKANVPETVIPKKSRCTDLANFFKGKDAYSESQSCGSNYTPKVGDLFFLKDYDHVGFVYSVNTNTKKFTVVDGNWGNAVATREYSFLAESVIGFATPAYGDSGHTISWKWAANQHWRGCDACDYISGAKKNHEFTYKSPYYICSVCNYKTTRIEGIVSITPDHDII